MEIPDQRFVLTGVVRFASILVICCFLLSFLEDSVNFGIAYKGRGDRESIRMEKI